MQLELFQPKNWYMCEIVRIFSAETKMRNYYVKFWLRDESEYYLEVPEDQFVLKKGETQPQGTKGEQWLTEGQMIAKLFSGEFKVNFTVPTGLTGLTQVTTSDELGDAYDLIVNSLVDNLKTAKPIRVSRSRIGTAWIDSLDSYVKRNTTLPTAHKAFYKLILDTIRPIVSNSVYTQKLSNRGKATVNQLEYSTEPSSSIKFLYIPCANHESMHDTVKSSTTPMKVIPTNALSLL